MNAHINPLASSLRTRKTNIIYLLLLVASLSIYSCSSNDTKQGQTKQVVQKTDSVKAAHDSEASQLNAARLQIDNLLTQKSALDSQIAQKDAEISRLKKDVKHLDAKNKALIAKLEKDEKIIRSLKDELSEKARSFAERFGIMQTENTYLKKERDSFMSRYSALKELGSVLHVSNFRLEPIHIKRNGKKEKATERAKKTDDLRVIFDIDENHIADNGVKDLYLVITGPGGKLLTSTTNNSGTITTSKGKTVGYSILKEIRLRKDEPVKDVQVDWIQDDDYEKGTYTISIYNAGYIIGGGSVDLR